MGRLAESLVLFDATGELVDVVPVVQAYAGAGHAHLLQLMGRLDESQRWYDSIEPVARERGQWVALLLLWDVQGQRRVREGQFAEASDLYVRLEAAGERLGIGEPCLVPWARHAIIANAGAGR